MSTEKSPGEQGGIRKPQDMLGRPKAPQAGFPTCTDHRPCGESGDERCGPGQMILLPLTQSGAVRSSPISPQSGNSCAVLYDGSLPAEHQRASPSCRSSARVALNSRCRESPSAARQSR
jgi:hypothetical protein